MPGAARKKNASLFDQFELLLEPVALPSLDGLIARCAALLRENGATNLAARVRVEWNAQMRTTVGRADFRAALVTLNPALQKFGAHEIDRTLRHELAHLLAQDRVGRRRIAPHGEHWRRACADLGLAGEHACHRLPLAIRHLPRRYLYRCAFCQRDFPRVRRLRRATTCLVCCTKFARGNYDARFRLIRIKSTTGGRYA
ncbi:MAG: SprT-like domain-containing protein [Verrucomicrobiota bacterium]|nr:SprT-like domain-containing protein [Verrucomicrobiota bacterium]